MSEAVTLPPEQVAEEEPRVPTRRLLVFEVGGGAFACDMESFREIIPTQPMTRLPGAPNTVCGLINLRGTIVTVIDGGIVLGKAGYTRTRGLILLVDYLERWIGIGVDDVRDIQDVPIDQFSAAGASEASQVGINGAVEIEEQRVLVLDIKAVVEQVIGQGR
ncbi:MAG: chemotaxis protein CheW [Gemmatimonadota bacterium]|nr:chemotaxis protein CheW [Gemmatimonadota bacterium]